MSLILSTPWSRQKAIPFYTQSPGDREVCLWMKIQGETGQWAFGLFLLCWAQRWGDNCGEQSCACWKLPSLFNVVPGLLNIPHQLSPQVAAIKAGALDLWSKPFTPQAEAGSWGLPLNCMALGWEWDLWWECIPAFPTHFEVLCT